MTRNSFNCRALHWGSRQTDVNRHEIIGKKGARGGLHCQMANVRHFLTSSRFCSLNRSQFLCMLAQPFAKQTSSELETASVYLSVCLLDSQKDNKRGVGMDLFIFGIYSWCCKEGFNLNATSVTFIHSFLQVFQFHSLTFRPLRIWTILPPFCCYF